MVAPKTRPSAARRNPSSTRGDGRRAKASYEGDYYSWALEQAELLRGGRVAEADLENIAEELTDLGREEFHKLVNAYRVLLLHMLKWDLQPERRTRSWAISIAVQREIAVEVVADNPGLKSRIEEAARRAYRRARLEAAGETGLKVTAFPPDIPYTLDDIMTRDFPLD
jgi:hypothetical protein